MSTIVSVDWLKENLNNENLILLDASARGSVENASAEESLKTIPGARWFDLKDQFSDKNSPFPNTLPPTEEFELQCRELGINQNSTIVVFDDRGIYHSPRVWWMFKVMGHEDVAVLNGGLPEWIEQGLPVEMPQRKEYPKGNFKAALKAGQVKTFEDITDNIDRSLFKVVDARSQGRFQGIAPEPRQHLKSGNIPGSLNLPYTEVLTDGKFKPEAELRALFNSKGIPENAVYSCGSGLTACIIMLAGHLAGNQSKSLYDGSWTEWAERNDLKV